MPAEPEPPQPATAMANPSPPRRGANRELIETPDQLADTKAEYPRKLTDVQEARKGIRQPGVAPP
ncbi:hypothetical protein GCM10009780_10280 [Actinomadura alba]